MKKLLKLFVCLAVVVFAGCSGSSEPKDIAKDVAECLQNQDYEEFVDILSANQEFKNEDKDQAVSFYKEKLGRTYEKKGGIESYEIGEQQIFENMHYALVPVTFKYGNGSSKTNDFKFIQQDGKWIFVLR